MHVYEVPAHIKELAARMPEHGMGHQDLITRFRYEVKHNENGFLVAGSYFVPRTTLVEPVLGLQVQSERHVCLDVHPPKITAYSPRDRSDFLLFVQPDGLHESMAGGPADIVYSLTAYHTLTYAGEVFWRLSAFEQDYRVGADGSLLPGSYATTQSDARHIGGGVEAINRYALPFRIPVTHALVFHPPPETVVLYSAVRPQHGLAGGGIEACFPNGLPPGALAERRTIPWA